MTAFEFETTEAIAKKPARRKRVVQDDGWVPEMPECWTHAESLIANGVPRVLLHGIPGTGKTYAGLHYGIEDPESVVNIYVRDDSAEFQIIGSDVFHKDGSSGWRNGPALIAFLEGRRLIVNEIDRASQDAMDALMAICDDPESAGFTLPNGEFAKRHESFQVIATSNSEDLANDLGAALDERFQMKVEITHPHPEAIRALPHYMRRVAWDLSHAGVDPQQRMPIRAFREYARAIDLGVPKTYAARAAFGRRARELSNAMRIAAIDLSNEQAQGAPEESDVASC